MQEPLVSVIIPVYNGANYMREAIDSILNQTYASIELIVVNDGSKDSGATEKIALSYGDKIRYIHKQNGGVASALNEGIRHMKGKYFAWLSHDDVFYPEKIEKQVEILENQNAVITACSYNIFYNSGRQIPVPIVDFYGEQNISKSVFSVLHALIQFGGILMHRCVFERYGVFREDLKTTQDYEFLFRVLREEKCIFSNDILYGIRYHEEQGSNTLSSVNSDRDDMYSMFITTLAEHEKKLMYGSVYSFYYQMLLRIWPMPNMVKSIALCMKGLQETEFSSKAEKPVLKQPIYIYGAGIYGRRILFDLRCREIEVAGFMDGNSSLWGKNIEGIICYSIRDYLKGNINGSIIIASIFREEIAEQLKANGINNYVFKEEYEQKMIGSAPEFSRVQEEVKKHEPKNE